MNLKKLKERLSLIEKDLTQVQSNFNLLEGAKRECLYWIEVLEIEKNNAVNDLPISTTEAME